MFEIPFDNCWDFDTCDHFDGAAALVTGSDIDFEHASSSNADVETFEL
jgi:hypothetical protein